MGRLFCLIWAHRWTHLYENFGHPVYGCSRCLKVRRGRT
jgi:hypothetical protein